MKNMNWISVKNKFPEEYTNVIIQAKYSPDKKDDAILLFGFHDTDGDFYAVDVFYDDGTLVLSVDYSVKLSATHWLQEQK